MRDFKAMVRRKVGPLPLTLERAEEIVLELAQQMEDAYREAQERGLPEAQAEVEAMAQLGDPEKLRRSIVSAERGEKALWPHPWAIPRAVCWMALASLAALCLVPGFRQALLASSAAWSRGEPGYSDGELRKLAAQGSTNHDARLLAFAALHLRDEFEASQLAEQAMAIDPSLTWVGARFITRHFLSKEERVDQQAWAKRVIAWDPENAVPRLLASEQLFRSQVPYGMEGPADDPLVMHLTGTTTWGEQMRAAFRAPRYDTYSKRKFELENSVLSPQRSGDRENLVWCAIRGEIFPDPTQIQRYSALVTGKLALDAERAGRNDEAGDLYWSVARFGEQMEGDADWPWQRAFAWQLQKSAYAGLGSLAGRTGKTQEKIIYELLSQRLERTRAETLAAAREASILSESSGRAGILAWFAAWLVMFTTIASALWAALAGVRGSDRVLTGWQGALAMGSSYAPGLLLGISVALYATMAPFLRFPQDFANQHSVFVELGPFWFSFWSLGPLGPWRLYAERIVEPAALSLAVLLLGIGVLQWLARHRAARNPQAQ